MFALRLPEIAPLPAVLAATPKRGRFCLDGLARHPRGRWTFLGAEPREVVRVEQDGDPFIALDAMPAPPMDAMRGDAIPLTPSDVPWWVGFVAYDAAWGPAARRVGLRRPARLAREGPALHFGRYESIIALDEESGEAWALAADREECARIARWAHGAEVPEARTGELVVEPPSRHRARIHHALEAIGAGEIYQVNLARPWRASYDGSPLALWAAMREASPVPLGMYLELSDRAIVGRTMERFLRWDREARRLATCPIKGTIARRGDDVAETEALLADDKERAEHSMIVDLMRNDLGRVAAPGTVEVIAPFRVEPFAGLSHLVSTVRCTVREGTTTRDILEATFPPGSITGTPKLRAMELIETEEDVARGVYTGALGYVDREGGLSLAVAIRTAVVASGEALYFAGGGLVSASDPEREIAETELKARVFLDAVERLSY